MTSRLSISDKYYKLKHGSLDSVSPSSDKLKESISDDYHEIKRITPDSSSPGSEELKEEFHRLHESTREALQQSWDEVENLQQQCYEKTDLLLEMEEEIKTWKLRCLTAEEKLKRNRRRSLTESVMSWTSKSNIDKDRDGPRDGISELEQSLKVSSRDEAISFLEQALLEQMKSLQNMETEMKNLIEKQKIKEKNMRESHTKKEERLNGLVESLREELKRYDVSRKDT